MMKSNDFIGFHYDIARGAYLKPEVFCQALQCAAASGYTHFLPYLENMIRLPAMEKACPSCAYTAADWQRFDAVAAEAGIKLVPHFNVIGHTADICQAYPELAGASQGKSLDVELDVTRQWMLRCLEEYCAFAKGEDFLIGGDEWQPPHHLLARADFDPGRAWVSHINAAVEFLCKQGRRPLVWHDMLIHYPAAIDELSRDATILFWFYDEDSDYPALSMLKERGFRVLMASGMSNGMLDHRWCNAARTALRAMEQHQADGFVMTTWTDGRWEKQQFNIPAIAGILHGNEPPEAILDAMDLMSIRRNLPEGSEAAHTWMKQIRAVLEDDAWQSYPDLHRVVTALVNNDTSDNLASYLRYHADQGPLYEQIASPPEASQPKTPQSTDDDASGGVATDDGLAFGLRVDEHDQLGPILRFYNDDESFEVYPTFGATLQNWRRGNDTIIPHTIDRLFASELPMPGGYRSYSRLGGFRPIWALGTHSNPCILWQHAFEWSVLAQTPERVTVQLSQEQPHVAVTYHITIERGQSGFTYEANARNKLHAAYGGFNFNAPFRTVEDIRHVTLAWESCHGREQTTLADKRRSAFWIPASSPLTVTLAAGTLHIDADPDSTAGYFVDWTRESITPDLHSVYRKLAADEQVTATWRFTLLNRKSAATARDAEASACKS